MDVRADIGLLLALDFLPKVLSRNNSLAIVFFMVAFGLIGFGW